MNGTVKVLTKQLNCAERKKETAGERMNSLAVSSVIGLKYDSPDCKYLDLHFFCCYSCNHTLQWCRPQQTISSNAFSLFYTAVILVKVTAAQHLLLLFIVHRNNSTHVAKKHNAVAEKPHRQLAFWWCNYRATQKHQGTNTNSHNGVGSAKI